MPPRIYETSKRLGPISHDQLSRALARFELGDLLTVEPVPFGLFGQNLFVTSSVGEFVFRGAPHGPTQFPTERFFTRILHQRTSVPVAWPYQVDDSCDFFPWSYVIMPRMQGLQVTDRKVRSDLSGDDLRAIARAMAHNLVAMQQVTKPHCARYDPDRDVVRPVPVKDHAEWPFNNGYGDVSQPPTHRELVTARIRRILERSQSASDRTTAADVEWADGLVERAQDALAVPFSPCFAMEDYKEGNVVVSRTSDGWRVTGAFDFMGCYFGDGETDLSRIMAEYFDQDPELAREFLATYMRLCATRPGFRERFPLYMLLDRLIIWEYVQRHEPAVASKMGTLRDWTERYTQIADTLGFGG